MVEVSRFALHKFAQLNSLDKEPVFSLAFFFLAPGSLVQPEWNLGSLDLFRGQRMRKRSASTLGTDRGPDPATRTGVPQPLAAWRKASVSGIFQPTLLSVP